MSRRRFSTPNSKEEVLNKCPLCGSELEFIELCQYSEAYKILQNGKISKTRKYKRDEGYMECGFIACSNDDCNFHTDCDLDTDTTGDYKHIYIHQGNNDRFYIDVDKENSR